jgi:uncharacterized protein (DUF302 family)
MKKLLMITAAVLFAGQAHAEPPVIYPYDGSFDDATFSVEDAIVSKGLVIDYISHTGEMLNRTGADLGATKEIFKAADIFLFCSAVVSRKVMEADPLNIAHCPYSIFVFENEDGVKIGHRNYPEGVMKQVQELLSGIVETAVDG